MKNKSIMSALFLRYTNLYSGFEPYSLSCSHLLAYITYLFISQLHYEIIFTSRLSASISYIYIFVKNKPPYHWRFILSQIRFFNNAVIFSNSCTTVCNCTCPGSALIFFFSAINSGIISMLT